MKHSPSLTGNIWRFRGEKQHDETVFNAFCRVRKLSGSFFHAPSFSDLADASGLPGVNGAARRIEKAIRNNEKILIFGDFDSDGASGAAVLYLALKTLGGNASVVLPSRSDGYGLSEKVYDFAKTNGVSLLVTVDCGSSNSHQIAYGNTLEIDTIVTDHHSLPTDLPPAVAVVHPHLTDPQNDLWDLTGAGVAFFLAKHLLEKEYGSEKTEPILGKLAELAVLGTVADVGNLVGQNRILTYLGLEQMKKMQHPGLRALMQAAKIDPGRLTAESIAFFLAPRLNAAGRLAHPNLSLSLLLGSAKAAIELEQLNDQRKDVTADLCALADKLVHDPQKPFFALYHDRFFSGVAGLIAARVSEKYHRPAVVLSQTDDPEMLTASCRGPEDFHFTQALKRVAGLLHKFGGHAGAAGFSMPKTNFARFESEFSAVVRDNRGDTPPAPQILADFETTACGFFEPDFPEIFRAAPFGAGNPDATFCVRDIAMNNGRIIGKDGTHLSGRFQTEKRVLPFVAFRFAETLPESMWNRRFDALVTAELSSWNGREEVRLKVKDMKVTGET